MKSILFSVFVICTVSSGCSSEIPASEVPSIVMNSFKERFSDPMNTEWEKQNELFEAEFEHDHIKHKVQITPTGQITAFKRDIHPGELPEAIQAVIRSDFKDYRLDDAEKLEINGQIYYQIEFEKKVSNTTRVFTETGAQADDTLYWD